MLNDVESVLLSTEELAKRIGELGAEITADYVGKDILMIGVLRGAVVFMADLADLCDVFYIGGTKVGAMFGEAVCVCNDDINRDFRYHIKQHGGLLAKGRFLGVQFETLFKDGLYLEISRNAVNQAMRIKEAFQSVGCDFLYDSPTNQQFPIINDAVISELSKNYSFSVWQKMNGGLTAVRFATSWATKEENVDTLVNEIRRICRIYGEKTPHWSVDMPE